MSDEEIVLLAVTERLEEDIVIRVQKLDGSSIRILVPKELDGYEDEVYGLNQITEGHYY